MSDEIGQCPVCFESAAVQKGPDIDDVNCARCGKFRIVGSGLGSQPGDFELQPYLSCYTRQANERSEVITLNSRNWRDMARAHRFTPFTKKVDMLLDLAVKRCNSQLGEPSEIDLSVDYPLVDAIPGEEFSYLIRYMLTTGYLVADGVPTFYMLQPKAWERLEAASTGQGIPGKCFVAMSFNKKLKKPIFDQGIGPAIEIDCKMTAVRIDLVPHNDNIVDKIIAEIRTCQFMVADFTGHKAGVYFEAGFAKGLGREVIWTCREDHFKNIHFDVAQFSHIVWKNPSDLRTRLANRIKATIRGAI